MALAIDSSLAFGDGILLALGEFLDARLERGSFFIFLTFSVHADGERQGLGSNVGRAVSERSRWGKALSAPAFGVDGVYIQYHGLYIVSWFIYIILVYISIMVYI